MEFTGEISFKQIQQAFGVPLNSHEKKHEIPTSSAFFERIHSDRWLNLSDEAVSPWQLYRGFI